MSGLTTIGIFLRHDINAVVETLNSVHAQTVETLDILIVSSASNKSSLQEALIWIKEHSSRFNCVEILTHSETNEDVLKDAVLERSKTPYIFLLREGEFIYPRCVAVCETCLNDNPDVSFAHPIAKVQSSQTLASRTVRNGNVDKKWENISSISLIRRSNFLQMKSQRTLDAVNDTYLLNYDETTNLQVNRLEANYASGVQIPEILATFYSELESQMHSEIKHEVSTIDIDSLRLSSATTPGAIEEISANNVLAWHFNTNKEEFSQKLCLRVDGKDISTQVVYIPEPQSPQLKVSDIIDQIVWFTIRIPDQYLDGMSHQIEVLTEDNRSLGTQIEYKFELRGNLDIVTTSRVAGWIADMSANFPVDLDLFVNGRKEATFSADLERKDVGETAKCGFDVTFTTQSYTHQSIEIRLKDSEYSLFETPTVLLSNSGVVGTLQKMSAVVLSCSDAFSSIEKQWLLEHLSPALIQSFREAGKIGGQSSFDCSSIQLIKPKARSGHVSDIVDVVIPVYRNLDVTKHCIQKAINAQNKTPFNIVVIDDKSPDPEIRTYLSHLSETGQIELLVNIENEGFVRSVNRGMRLHEDRDIVLLNSDAIVQDYWLDRLYASAYVSSNIASSTPLSNHASIFSYPRICKEVGTLPSDVTPVLLDKFCFELNQKQSSVYVPSMHGFCCFIKRDALQSIGLFDADKWGKGYGEEVDWSQKAASRGWRHVAAPSVFVEHVGSQSFSAGKDKAIEKALAKLSAEYPDFDSSVQDFIRRDPLAICRRRLDLVRLQDLCGQYMLFVSHHLGGGIKRHIQDMALRLKEENICSLILQPAINGWVSLSSADGSIDFEAKYNLNESKERYALIADLKKISIQHVHIHSTIGYLDQQFIWELPKRMELDYDVTVHDYQAICPRVNLVRADGQYCGEPSTEQCDRCIALNGTYPDYALEHLHRELKTVQLWRQYFFHYLKSARTVFAPSQDTVKRMKRHFELSNVCFMPHPEEKTAIELSANNTEGAIAVAIIGAISDIKGYQHLYECATQAHKLNYPLKFIVFGYTKNDELFTDLNNVLITGSYETSEELKQLLEKHPCDVAAFLSTWPETYSYTLSESLLLGLLPVGFNIGAFPTRVENIPESITLELNSSTTDILNSLVAAGKKARKAAFSDVLAQSKTYEKMSKDYYQVSTFSQRT